MMMLSIRSLVLLLAVLLIAPGCRTVPQPEPPLGGTSRLALRRIPIPITFEPGQGEADGEARYLHRAAWGALELHPDRLAFELRVPRVIDTEDAAEVAGSSPETRLVEILPVGGTLAGARGRDEFDARANVYDGADPQRTRTGLPLFGRVCADNVWPSVSFELGTERQRLAFRMEVGAEVSLEQVAWEVRGAEELRIDEHGALRILVEHGELVLAAPRFRAVDGASNSRRLTGSYHLKGTRFGFTCEDREPGERLEIDPLVEFASLFGDSEYDVYWSLVALDGPDIVYLCRFNPEWQLSTPQDEADVLLLALDVSDLDAPELLFQTALEGVLFLKDAEAAFGRLLLGGNTHSTTLPVAGGGFQVDAVEGVTNMMLLSLDATSGTVEHATYLGEPNQVPGYFIQYRLAGIGMVEYEGDPILGVGGSVRVLGQGTGTSPQPLLGYQGPSDASPTTYAGGTDDVCFARFSFDLSTLETLSFAGGEHREWLSFLDAVPGGFLGAGYTLSQDFPTTPGAFQQTPGTGFDLGQGDAPLLDSVVMRWTAGGELSWSTLLGGPGGEAVRGLAVSETGEPTMSILAGIGQVGGVTSHISATARLAADGTALAYVKPLLSELGDSVDLNVMDSIGVLPGPGGWVALAGTLVGDTDNLTVSPNAFDSEQQGMEIYYAHLEPNGEVAYASFLGGSSLDRCHDLAVDAEGGVWVSGMTLSDDFPAAVGAPAGTQTPSGIELFLVKIAGKALAASLEKSVDADPVPTGALVYFTVQLANEGDQATPPTTLVDDLPAGWELAYLPPGWTDDEGSVTIPVPELEPGESFTVSVTAEAPPDSGTYTNLVSWTSFGFVHATATETITVLDAEDIPELFVTIEGPLTSMSGMQQLYRLAVQNVGAGVAPGVVLSGETSSIKDLRFDSAGEPAAVVESEWVAWSIGELAPEAKVTLDVLATTGSNAGLATLTARATTSLLPGTIAEVTHTTTILGTTADLAIETLEPEVSGDFLLRSFVVSETSGATAPLGSINVLIEFTADLPPAAQAVTSLVAPGPSPPAIPILIDPAEDLWALSINLHAATGLPQTVTWKMPTAVLPSQWTVRVHGPAVNDPFPENDVVSGP